MEWLISGISKLRAEHVFLHTKRTRLPPPPPLRCTFCTAPAGGGKATACHGCAARLCLDCARFYLTPTRWLCKGCLSRRWPIHPKLHFFFLTNTHFYHHKYLFVISLSQLELQLFLLLYYCHKLRFNNFKCYCLFFIRFVLKEVNESAFRFMCKIFACFYLNRCSVCLPVWIESSNRIEMTNFYRSAFAMAIQYFINTTN